MAILVKMKLTSLYLLILAACASVPQVNTSSESFSQPHQSKVQKIGEIPLDNGKAKLYFLNRQVGWFFDQGSLWTTADGGSVWEIVYSASANEQTIEKVEFVNSYLGWMIKGGALFRTEDSGRTWTPMPVPISFPHGELRDFKFLADGKVGWIAGGLYRPVSQREILQSPNNAISPDSKAVLEGAILRTDDGGERWRQQSLPNGEAYRFLQLYFFDAKHGIALGDTGVVYTLTGGDPWKTANFRKGCVDQQYRQTAEGRPINVFFLDSNKGWLSFTDGYVAKSDDGGRTWCDLLHPEDVWSTSSYNTFFQKIIFTDESHGWGLGADGTLYETTDKGVMWAKYEASVKFDDIFFLNADQGWAVAKNILYRIG
jgi:photosystem II stability/assembly factor-like uncharacterized protein